MDTKNLLFNPKTFFQRLSWKDHKNEIIILAILAGIVRSFAEAQTRQFGDKWELMAIIGFCLTFGLLLGWLSLYFVAIIVRWSGEIFGGRASNKELFAVAAYASVPSIFALIPLAFQIILYGKNAFRNYTLVDNRFDYWILCTLGAIQLILGIYSLFLFLKGVSVVQQFNMVKATKSIFLVPGILFIVGIIIFFLNQYL